MKQRVTLLRITLVCVCENLFMYVLAFPCCCTSLAMKELGLLSENVVLQKLFSACGGLHELCACPNQRQCHESEIMTQGFNNYY